MPIHEGGGSVRKSPVSGDRAAALDSGYCHYQMCQRNSGAPVVAWAPFPTTGFEWSAGKAAGY
jgi:hypothetical protein